jgi:2-phospho-L-lactate guanylyltransferase (CobY/MobA/RfbA family)
LQITFNDTAILLFSRTCASEAAAKNFFIGKGDKKNQQIAAQLIKRTVSVATESGLPYYLIDERQQVGTSFGERLTNAIQTVYNEGFQKVIVIGNDCLQLDSKKIHAAADALNNHQQVLMPTAKGGVSLIGLNKSSFATDAFTSIPWQTDSVFEALNLLYHSTFVLPVADDVNNFIDLKNSIRHLSPLTCLYTLITSFIASLQSVVIITVSDYTSFDRIFFGLRAPPVYS